MRVLSDGISHWRCIWVGAASITGFLLWTEIFELVHDGDPGVSAPLWSLLLALLVGLLVTGIALAAIGVVGRWLILNQAPRRSWRSVRVETVVATCLGCPALLGIVILVRTIGSCSTGAGC